MKQMTFIPSRTIRVRHRTLPENLSVPQLFTFNQFEVHARIGSKERFSGTRNNSTLCLQHEPLNLLIVRRSVLGVMSLTTSTLTLI